MYSRVLYQKCQSYFGSGICVVSIELFFVITKITHLGKVQMPDRRVMLCQYLKRVNATVLVIAGLLA